MDYSLSTWPSITQYDDFSWAGLGDIDPLESLHRSNDNNPGTSPPNSQENMASMPSADTGPERETLPQISNPQGCDLYRLRSSESLAVARWESINAEDLESVLGSALPSQDTTATSSGENMYDLYSDGITDDMDAFMSDSMSGNRAEDGRALPQPREGLQMNVSAMTPDAVSLSRSQEDIRCENTEVDGDSTTSINALQPSISSPVPPAMVDRNIRYAEPDNADGLGVQMVQPYLYNPIHGDPCPSSRSPLDLKELMSSQQLRDIQTNRVMQWPNTASTSAHSQVFDGAKVHHSSLYARDSYPDIMKQQERLADVMGVEMKRTRAQACRARRRAASQRRAKKYPLQKLIRMSSPPNGARDMLDQNLTGVATMSLARGIQVPGLLPDLLQSPHLASNHKLLPQSNRLQEGRYYCYQPTSVAPTEDKSLHTGSGTGQSVIDQEVQSMASTSSMSMSGLTGPTQCLDAVVLEQLRSLVGKMNADMRLCVRDAFYRLANSSKHRQNKTDSASNSSLSLSSEAMETNTNLMDRWIVNILFCKQPTSFHEPYPQFYARTQVGDLGFKNVPSNSSLQRWNSCGSSMNLQEQPLHVVTGL